LQVVISIFALSLVGTALFAVGVKREGRVEVERADERIFEE
jgi:hypothetical protein